MRRAIQREVTHFERLITLKCLERRRTKRTGSMFLHSKVHSDGRKSKAREGERTRRTSRKVLSDFARHRSTKIINSPMWGSGRSSSKQDTSKLFSISRRALLCILVPDGRMHAMHVCVITGAAPFATHNTSSRPHARVFPPCIAMCPVSIRARRISDVSQKLVEIPARVHNPVYLRIGFVLCELIGRREASKSEASIAAVDPRGREFPVPLKVYRYKGDRVI